MFPEFEPSDKASFFGNYLIIGLSNTKLSDTDKRLLSELRPAGVLLLGRNFNQTLPYSGWLNELKNLLAEIKRYAGREKMIVSLDHEGGRVMRTPAPLTRFPEPIKYRKNSAAVGKAHGIEIRSLGVNVSWAPVADVHSNPANPIIGERAFSTNAKEACDFIVPYAEALMAEGVLGCAKHFPGHGDTLTDSHLVLPTVDINEKILRERELPPFKALVEIEIPFFMTAHILYPQIDPNYPATLSKKILKGIVRDEWNYKGLIVSDDLDMKAVSAAFNADDTVARAFEAGCDTFIVARQPDPDSDRPLKLTEQMGRALRKRQLSEDTLFASYNRIRELFEKRLKMHEAVTLADDVLNMHLELGKSI